MDASGERPGTPKDAGSRMNAASTVATDSALLLVLWMTAPSPTCVILGLKDNEDTATALGLLAPEPGGWECALTPYLPAFRTIV